MLGYRVLNGPMHKRSARSCKVNLGQPPCAWFGCAGRVLAGPAARPLRQNFSRQSLPNCETDRTKARAFDRVERDRSSWVFTRRPSISEGILPRARIAKTRSATFISTCSAARSMLAANSSEAERVPMLAKITSISIANNCSMTETTASTSAPMASVTAWR